MKFFLEEIALGVLHDVLCKEEEIIENRSRGRGKNWAYKIYVKKIRDKIELIMKDKIEKELARINDMERTYDDKYQNMINRLLVIESVYSNINKEEFINEIVKRINEKQLK